MESLQYWRMAKGWSQDELAERANVSNKTVVDIERGKVRPKFRTIQRLCAALDVQPVQVREFMPPKE